MSTTIESLELQIQSDAKSATTGIDSLSTSLSKLKSTLQGGVGLEGVSNQIRNLNTSLNSADGNTAAKIDRLSGSLSKLSNLGKLNFSSNIGSQLQNLNISANSINTLGISRLTSGIKQLGQGEGAKGLANTTQQMSTMNQMISTLGRTGSMNFMNLWAKLSLLISGFRMFTGILGNWISSSNKYVEDLNLFTASMGSGAAEAQNFAEKVSNIMGIDPAEWMRNQGVFNTIIEGFGVASDRANIMSKNLTQLGYDLSSFYNRPYAEAMQRLSSGISGELEPLRRWGYDLSIARLQQEALNLGINQNINSMTQAEKAQLRYYAIMKQVTVVQGDMARTLNAPANQLRILGAQAVMAGRALGNIFIPILNKVLPYAIAFLKIVREIATALAQFFGFKLPKIDYSGVERTKANVGAIGTGLDKATGGANRLGRGMGKVAKQAQKAKEHILGIDELNVIRKNQNSPSGSIGGIGDIGGGGGGGIGGGDFKPPLPQYNFLKELMKQIDKTLARVKEKLKGMLNVLGAIFIAVVTFKFLSRLSMFLKTLGITSLTLSKIYGITMLIAGAFLYITEYINAWRKGVNWASVIKLLIAAAVIIGGLVLIFGGLAAKIGAVVLGISLFVLGIKDAIKNGLNFKNGVLIALGALLTGAAIGSLFGIAGGAIGAGMGLLVGIIALGIVWIIRHWDDFKTWIDNFFHKTIPDIWNGFKEKVTSLPDKVKEFFYNIWKPIKNFSFYDLGKLLGKGVGTVLKGIKNLLVSVLPGLFKRLSVFIGTRLTDGTLPNLFKKLWNFIKTKFSNFFTKTLPHFFGEVLPKTIEDIAKWFKKLPERIGKKVKEGAKKLWDVGANIVYGIVEGFKAKWKSKFDFIDGFVEGVKEKLGIKSPSRKFIEIAKYCADGLFLGLEKGTSNIGSWTKQNIVNPVDRAIENNPISEIGVSVKNTSSDWWENVKSWWKGATKEGVEMNAFVKLAKKGWDTVKEWIGKIPGVPQAIKLAKSGWNTVKGWIGKIPGVPQAIKLAKSGWNTVKDWVGFHKVPTGISLIKSGWSSLKDWVGNKVEVGISLVKDGWKSIKKFFGLSSGGYDTGHGFKMFRNGGFINGGRSGFWNSVTKYANGTSNAGVHGSLFVAGEAGAEMVGHIKGQTEVLNQSQIKLAMRSAVVSGMSLFIGYWRILNSQIATCTNAVIHSIVVASDILTKTMVEASSYASSDVLTQSAYANSVKSNNQAYLNQDFTTSLENFYTDYVEPTLKQIAEDTKRQADKKEKTVVQIGNRTVKDVVTAQQQADGFSFTG